jgi:ligand-binding sensor domain-containing protein
LFFSLSNKGYAQTAYLPHFTTKNGLPSNNCFYALQDKKGYLWIATDAGVSRFDGAVFENFSIEDGLPDNQILQLREDSKGRIWFLALNGQLSYFHNGKIYNQYNNTKLKQLNFDAIVVSFFEDSKGRIWFGTNKNTIGVWDEKTFIKYSSPNASNQFINTTIHEDRQGNIWAYSTQAVHLFLRNNFVLVKNTPIPLSYKTMVSTAEKSLYFLDKNGLNYKTGTLNTLMLPIDTSLTNKNLGYIYLGNKELWLSNSSGVYVMDFKGRTKQILKNIDVNQVIKDSNRNMWFTTKNGIYKLPDTKERLYIFNQDNGLSNNTVKSITKDKQNRLWLGLSGAQINLLHLKSKAVNKISLPDPQKYNLIKQLSFDKNKENIYFASDYGLGTLSSSYPLKTKINYLKETNNSVFVVKNFSLDTAKRLALALSSGVVIVMDRNEKFEFSSLNYKEKQDYFKDRSYSVFFDKAQSLWFSNLKGVSEFKEEKLNKFYEKDALLTKRINDIKQLSNGNLAMATDGYGILIVKNGKVVNHITQKQGLNNNIINKLFVKDDNLWAISRNGINSVSFVTNRIKVNTFDYANNLLSDDLNDLYIDTDTAYFATNNGLVYFAHSQQTMQTQVPKVYISAVTKNRELLDLGLNNFILGPGQHNMTFNFSAVDFKNKRIVYRYRLKGDAAWSETRNRRVEISTPEPGNYAFEVSAKTEDSEWSKPAKVSFTIQKHFWQTWAFIIVLLVLGAYVLYRIAVRITKTQKNKEQEQLLLKNKILMLELQALQAMMNPHFVFNVMNSIQHYINTKNTSSANKVLTGFAKLIRKNLDICTKSYISLEEEIEYLNLYLRLEKYRFGDKFSYYINIDEDLDTEEILIPSMILQPYLENAIWHGMKII